MTQIFANRTELLPLGETTEEHKKWQEEEAALVEKDRSDTGPSGGLFRGCFTRRRGILGSRFPADYMDRPPIRDVEDGVDRCPRCTWELEDGLCHSCGYPSGAEDLSDTDSPEYAVDFDGDGDHVDYDTPGALMYALDHRGAARNFNREYSPASLSPSDAASAFDLHDPHRPHPIRASSPYGDEAGTPYDSTFEESYGDSEDDDEGAGSLHDFVVDDADERHRSSSSSIRSLHWETDDGTEAEDVHTQHSEGEHAIGANLNDDDEDMSLHSSHTDQYNVEEDSDEGPMPPSRRQVALRENTWNFSSSEDDTQPIALQRGQRHRHTNRGGRNSALHSQRRILHHSRIALTNGARSGVASIDLDSDSDAPVSASQAIRNRRTQRPNPLNDDSGPEGSSGTATVGRLSPTLMSTRRSNDRSDARDSHHISPILIDSGPIRSTNHEPPNEGNPPHDEDNEEPTFPQRNQPLNDTHLHQENRGSPGVNFDRSQSTFSSPQSRRTRGSRHLSPLPLWSRHHSPAAGPSRPSIPGEPVQQGMRDRQARRAERKAERRRIKAERQRRRSAEATRSASSR